MPSETFTIRDVRNTDSAALIDLVGRCFADYPGCVLEVDLEEPELRAPADKFEQMWVAETAGGHIAAMIAAKTTRHEQERLQAPSVELKKLYIDHRWRGCGLARRMIDQLETYARAQGADRIDLWSDTRFDKAHVVYSHFGWRMQRAIRDLHDLSNTREYYFVKSLSTERRESSLADS